MSRIIVRSETFQTTLVHSKQILLEFVFLYGSVWNCHQKVNWFLEVSVRTSISFSAVPHWTLRTPGSIWVCQGEGLKCDIDFSTELLFFDSI